MERHSDLESAKETALNRNGENIQAAKAGNEDALSYLVTETLRYFDGTVDPSDIYADFRERFGLGSLEELPELHSFE